MDKQGGKHDKFQVLASKVWEVFGKWVNYSLPDNCIIETTKLNALLKEETKSYNFFHLFITT